MEFWGCEVKAGQTLKVEPEIGAYIHLSQAALGESKNDKGGEPVVLNLKFGDQKFVLGSLSRENFPQIPFDLVLDNEFELSHNWKNGSVYFCGYQAQNPDEDDFSEFDSEEDEEEALPVTAPDNGKVGKGEESKAAASEGNTAKPGVPEKQVKVAEPKKDEDDSDSDDEDESDESDEESGSDEEMIGADGDSEDSDEDGDEENEDTPAKKVQQGKKRPNESASKTLTPAKKGNMATPQKNDAKKGGHTLTPHPAKKAGKTPVPNSKSKDQTPKSGVQFSHGAGNKSSGGSFQKNKKAKFGGR